jgi:hypothetical protein
MPDISQYITPENHQGEKDQEELSPSGKYRLLIRWYKTQGNGWEYTQGCLFDVENGREITTVERNYSSFHHSFVTQYGVEYLITGRSYMGLTIIRCEDGKEWNYKPTKEDWCQVSWVLSPDEKTLLVNACVWGGPFMYDCFDFDLDKFDHASGLPRLKMDWSSINDEEYGPCSMEDDDYSGTNIGWMKGKDIPSEIKEDFVPEEDVWYLVYYQKYKYNSFFKEKQYYVMDEYCSMHWWLKVVPEELQTEIHAFKDKWKARQRKTKDDWDEYSVEAEIIKAKCKPYLREHCSVVYDDVTILQRVDDRMIYCYYRGLPESESDSEQE